MSNHLSEDLTPLNGRNKGQTCGFQSWRASNDMLWEATRRNLLPQGNQNQLVLPMGAILVRDGIQ